MTTNLNLIKQISLLMEGSSEDLWIGLTRLARKRSVSAVNLKCENTTDVRSAFYIYSCGTQVVFLLLDTLLSSDRDELADEEGGPGEEPPLYFTSSGHRPSPVFLLWREAQLWRNSNPGNADEIFSVVLTNSFIINYEGASADWNLADVRVRHNLRQQPKGLPTNSHISEIDLKRYVDSYPEKEKSLPTVSDYINNMFEGNNSSEQQVENNSTNCNTIDWDDLIDGDDPDFIETTYLLNGETKKKKTLPNATLLPPLSDPMQVLENMTGLYNIKNYIRKLTLFLDYQKTISNHFPEKSSLLPKRNLHCVFLGGVGTGKTTVAQIFSSLLHERGYLSRGHTIVCNRGSFASKYFGGEEQNVRRLIKCAQGGCLVIDEAYTLESQDERDPCNNILNLMLDVLADEKNRDICVILAGYLDPMRHLLNRNDGFISRFPNVFIFEDFTYENLIDIAIRRIERVGYSLTADGLDKLRAHIFQMYQNRTKKTFGNARDVANLCEKIFIDHAVRCMEEKNIEPAELLKITAADIATSVNTNILQSDRKYVGFK